MLLESESDTIVGSSFHAIVDVACLIFPVPSNYRHAQHESIGKISYLLLVWLVLHFFYKQCINSLLRRMNFPLIRRNRIIESIWHFGFNLGSAYFLKLTENSSGEHVELCLRFYESFYLHTAAIHAFSNGNWMQAAHDFLFATSLFSFTNKTIFPYLSQFLYYKCIDGVLMNFSRIMISLEQKDNVGKSVARALIVISCLSWMFQYILFSPSPELRVQDIDSKEDLLLSAWFLLEFLASIYRLKIFRNVKSTALLESCLFPPLSHEAIELANIQKRHKDFLNSKKKVPSETKRKQQEMWQTLLCAMVIKKKIKRLRQNRIMELDEKLSSVDDDDDTLLQNDKETVVDERSSD